MQPVILVHWKASEAEERLEKISKAGYDAVYLEMNRDALLQLRQTPPLAVVIDLDRMPSQGRDIALALRSYKDTRRVPIIFVEGDPDKVAGIKGHLPDAVYADWKTIKPALKKAISHPPQEPVIPKGVMDGYAGAPLVKKLGIKAGSTIRLIDPPENFAETIDNLPEDVIFIKDAKTVADTIIWFVQSKRELDSGIKYIPNKMSEKSGLWIAWPKKSSGIVSDITQPIVRSAGLATGLVDHKICSIDSTWSGLRFVKRRTTKR